MKNIYYSFLHYMWFLLSYDKDWVETKLFCDYNLFLCKRSLTMYVSYYHAPTYGVGVVWDKCLGIIWF